MPLKKKMHPMRTQPESWVSDRLTTRRRVTKAHNTTSASVEGRSSYLLNVQRHRVLEEKHEKEMDKASMQEERKIHSVPLVRLGCQDER